jgi:hypothetical protein
MVSGNKPVEGGYLILNEIEKNELLMAFPESQLFIKRFLGAEELLNNNIRYCLWIEDAQIEKANNIPPIYNRISQVKEFRLKSRDVSAQLLSKKSHQFRDFYSVRNSAIIIPQTTSENRNYIPLGFVNNDYIISNAARVIYEAETWMFSILTSRIHNNWVQAVAGRLETRIQYSNTLCYNTFPFPSITHSQKQELEKCVLNILFEREKHSEKTLAQLYDSENMPDGLREAHFLNDKLVESCYRIAPFESNEERIEYLFILYEQMIEKEKSRGTLFEMESKPKKKKK